MMYKKTPEKKCIAGLSDEICADIVRVILSHKMVRRIVVFGSRARRDFKQTSDIDVAVFAPDWSDRDINLAKSMLEERIRTPLKFDLLNYHHISKERLKKYILETGIVLYDSTKN